jgi:DTW domain-containing protein
MNEDCCTTCLKPLPLCVCAWVKPIATKTRVLILQHPKEPNNALSSARLAHLCLPSSTLKVGLSWPNLKVALGSPAEAKQWLVLYLGSAKLRARAAAAAASPLVLVDRHGEPLEEPGKLVQRFKGLVVLDGNWSEVKSLWWRNAWLLKLHRAVLVPVQPSLYQKLRREPRRESLSTIEAIALSLSVLEPKAEASTLLLRAFSQLLEIYRSAKPTKTG